MFLNILKIQMPQKFWKIAVLGQFSDMKKIFLKENHLHYSIEYAEDKTTIVTE